MNRPITPESIKRIREEIAPGGKIYSDSDRKALSEFNTLLTVFHVITGLDLESPPKELDSYEETF